ncbi:hypothetical protein V5O48_011890 [Marasmius crinis-equi]|uniref:Uncharacterized protein n=1 Tax=Marasmius crinis-equi TaxID=585013 RepID=A0ABR3F498_9AGAR
MVFYPDNVKRATRLQQLVDSCANMQTDVKHASDDFVKTNADLKPTVDSLLHKGGFSSFDDLYNKAMEKMTDDDRKKFEALIESSKKFADGIEIGYFITGLMMLPEGGLLTGQMALAAGRFVLKLSALQRVAQFFRAADSGVEAAATEAGEVGESGAEIAQGVRWMGRVGTFLKWLGVVGFVLTIVVGIIEAIEGAEQKRRLIEAIHALQPARLTIDFYKRQATNINQQLELFKLYFKEMNKEQPKQDLLKAYQEEIFSNLTENDDAIDWGKLEDELETQDRTAGNFYGGDDLPRDEVVKNAKEEK